jgi:hypothetical protein
MVDSHAVKIMQEKLDQGHGYHVGELRDLFNEMAVELGAIEATPPPPAVELVDDEPVDDEPVDETSDPEQPPSTRVWD